jgi:catechol 2,3-dioxygenase-like lactoylglutathione lyase family enzyme
MKRLVNIFFFFLVLQPVGAQELNAKVNVVYAQISSNVDKRVFQNLQTSLQNFINKRKWTSDNFESNEKIECSFLLNLQSVVESNVYKATLTVQAARPVYNTSYLSPLINFIDNDLVFRYVEFQPIEFNENRIAGTEPLTANLTAAIAFYVNLILGLDYDSFSPKGGDPFFQKANMIVNAAPEGRSITGWRAFDGQRNRYWLSENLQNSKYAQVHDAIYTYYRKGLDQMLTNEKDARTQIIQALNFLSVVHAESPNVMIIPFFFQGRSDEIIRIFKKSTPQEKIR